MNEKLVEFSMKSVRKVFSLFGNNRSAINELVNSFDFEGQAASDQIRHALQSEKPLMIARIGYTEMKTLLPYYLNAKYSVLEKIRKYANREISQFWWDTDSRTNLSVLSGFFPTTDEMLKQFSELLLSDLQEVDILGSWITSEFYLKDVLINAIKVPLKDLEPYYHKNPWSDILQGKKVLVIHPFSETIDKQFKNRHQLFQDKRVLPNFELITIKSVQSIAGNKPAEFETWFEALDSMKNQISKIDFDVAIIGAGAYGLSLAAHVKRIGKVGIHLGGATQILFGIKGARWEDHSEISKLFNEHWINPLPEDRPKGFEKIENGCYW